MDIIDTISRISVFVALCWLSIALTLEPGRSINFTWTMKSAFTSVLVLTMATLVDLVIYRVFFANSNQFSQSEVLAFFNFTMATGITVLLLYCIFIIPVYIASKRKRNILKIGIVISSISAYNLSYYGFYEMVASNILTGMDRFEHAPRLTDILNNVMDINGGFRDEYFIVAMIIYVLASILFVNLMMFGRAPLYLAWGKKWWEGQPVTFRESANEPFRLICGSAAVGKLPNEAAFQAEREHPYLARPFVMDCDHDRVAELIQARKDREATYHAVYISLAIIVIAILTTNQFGFLVFPILLASIIYYRKLSGNKYNIASQFSAKNFQTARPGRDTTDQHNLIVYRGYDPFAMFGWSFGNWLLTADVERPAKSDHRDRPSPVDVGHIEEKMVETVQRSADCDVEHGWLYFVQGSNIPVAIKPSGAFRPPSHISEELYERFDAAEGSPVRRYLWIKKSMWSEQVVISYFIRIFRNGTDLCIEINGTILPPPGAAYRWVDNIGMKTFRVVLGDFIASMFIGTFMMPISLLWFIGKINDVIGAIFGNKQKEILRSIEDNPNFDFGAPPSLRQRAADHGAVSYFQRMDRRVAEAAFNGRIVRTFIDCLDECGIDTSELREQRMTLLNQGILVQGGEVRADNIATGVGAKITATVNRVKSQAKVDA